MITMSGASAQRISEVLNEEPDITNTQNPVMEVKDGQIDFDDVYFSYKSEGSGDAVLDLTEFPHRPVIDIASSYKNARREAMLFEFRVGRSKLLVCTLNLRQDDPGAVWLKNRILSYAAGEDFQPAQTLTEEQLARLLGRTGPGPEANANEAQNPNESAV